MNFVKMQGLGNDFIIVDFQENINYSSLSKKMCDRHFGIGADGLIVTNPTKMQTKESDCSWYIYNSDGTQAQMCGNGMRCFAKYIFDRGLAKNRKIKVNTLRGLIESKILSNGKIRVNMGSPILDSNKIPFLGNNIFDFTITIDNNVFIANAISMGNPHCVIFDNSNTKESAEIFGERIENNELFPQKTNVEFVKIISRKKIELDVWERGCGITLACGTGSCAAVAVGILNDLLDKKVEVKLKGGTLIIEWDGNKDHPIYMTGEADYVFCGQWHKN